MGGEGGREKTHQPPAVIGIPLPGALLLVRELVHAHAVRVVEEQREDDELDLDDERRDAGDEVDLADGLRLGDGARRLRVDDAEDELLFFLVAY
jgi:hypothetical protein